MGKLFGHGKTVEGEDVIEFSVMFAVYYFLCSGPDYSGNPTNHSARILSVATLVEMLV